MSVTLLPRGKEHAYSNELKRGRIKMAKPIGTKGLLIRQAGKDLWGIWRVNEDGIPYLILTGDEGQSFDEVAAIGKQIRLATNLKLTVNKSKFY
jgi:hypothetical protein